ncbi:hypothetical protein F4604DRAFT_1677410 [Suillus subluteus]|nr:hypothetical protein F4604DRAFT_1677410 [Suillus subluteus]
MAPPRWTSAEQLLWLQNEMPGYLQMQKEKKLSRFFDALFPRWFSDFPEETELNGSPPCDANAGINEPSGADINEPSDAGIESVIKTAQLDSLNATDSVEQEDNQSNSPPIRAAERCKGKTTPGGSSTSRALSVLLGQRARGLAQSGNTPLNALQTSQKKLGDVEGQHLRTKEEVYRTIQELPLILGQVFEELSALTGGWHYTIVMGGADLLCEGDIMTLSYHHGKTTNGLSFKASTPNFHKQYLLPFERHPGSIHGKSIFKMYIGTLVYPNLISLDESPNESSLGDNAISGPVVDPFLLQEQEDLVLLQDPYNNLDFSGSAGVNQYGDWLMHASNSDPNLPSPRTVMDTPITAWRKSMARNEDPLISPTFNRVQQRGWNAVGPSIKAVPPVLPHSLSPLHATTLLPHPSPLFMFPGLEEVDMMPTLQQRNPLPFNQPMLNSGPHSPPYQSILLPLLPAITPLSLLVSTVSKSPRSRSIEHQSSLASHQPTLPAIGGVSADKTPPHNSEAMMVSTDHRSSPASCQPSPHAIVGISQPNLEVGMVSSLPTISAASSRCSGHAPQPSTRANGANKIGGQHETKLVPKRKQTGVQHGVGGSKKRSRK